MEVFTFFQSTQSTNFKQFFNQKEISSINQAFRVNSFTLIFFYLIKQPQAS